MYKFEEFVLNKTWVLIVIDAVLLLDPLIETEIVIGLFFVFVYVVPEIIVAGFED